MNYKERIIAVIMMVFLLCGCNFREITTRFIFPGTKVYTKHVEKANLSYTDNPEWWNYATLSAIRKRVDEYLKDSPECPSLIKENLQQLSIIIGMDKKQVLSVVGKPAKKKLLKSNDEMWIYTRNKNELPWFYKWAKLTFKSGVLTDIEVQHINIPK